MLKLSSEAKARRKTLAKSRYTIAGWLMPQRMSQQRIYEPTYQLISKSPVNFEHVNVIVRNCVTEDINYTMPTYDPTMAMSVAQKICKEIQFRIQIQNFDRFRTVAVVNIVEKADQGMSWQVGTLFDSTGDGWTHVQYEASTYVITAFVSCVYWD